MRFEEPTKEMQKPDVNKRLALLDALRRFDMLFIMGGGPFVIALCAALGFPDCAFAQ